jgi:hypothetical protein
MVIHNVRIPHSSGHLPRSQFRSSGALSGLSDLKNSITLAQLPAVLFSPIPLSVVPVAIQILVKRRMTYDAEKYLARLAVAVMLSLPFWETISKQ